VDDRQKDDDRFTASLAGLAWALCLGVAGLFLLEQMAAQSKLEDCLLQGRLNCERVELGSLR
jgi:hypothetical protein